MFSRSIDRLDSEVRSDHLIQAKENFDFGDVLKQVLPCDGKEFNKEVSLMTLSINFQFSDRLHAFCERLRSAGQRLSTLKVGEFISKF